MERVRVMSPAGVLQILRDPARKSILTMLREVLALQRTRGSRPMQYFRNFLYRKEVADPHAYLDFAQCCKLWARFRSAAAEILLTDKRRFHEHFAAVPGIRLPRHIGHTEGGVFHAADGTTHAFATLADLARLLEAEVAAGTAIFAKPLKGLSGTGAFRWAGGAPPLDLWAAVQDTDYLFQEAVTQHPALAAVMPDTLNSMRITTLRRGAGAPVVASAWIRFGRAGEVVDNASQGGVFSGIDLATGQLAGFCGMKFEMGGHALAEHPDTGHLLDGFEVPLFAEALEMALAAARSIEFELVGWDLGIAPDGPVLIEGNSGSNYASDEIANGVGYLAHPVLGSFLREILSGTARTSAVGTSDQDSAGHVR